MRFFLSVLLACAVVPGIGCGANDDVPGDETIAAGEVSLPPDMLLPGEMMHHALRPVLASRGGSGFGDHLDMQKDGNLVLYRSDPGPPWAGANGVTTAVWSTRTNGKGALPTIAYMQEDGNLVVYADLTLKSVLWASNTHGHPKAFLYLQPDGNLVIYHGTRAIWASNTVRPRVNYANDDGQGGWRPSPGCSLGEPKFECKGPIRLMRETGRCGNFPYRIEQGPLRPAGFCF